MTDQPNEDPQFFQSPEEVIAFMKRQHELAHMASEDSDHAKMRLFQSLAEDDLMTLKSMLLTSSTGAGDQGTAFAYYHVGVIDMVMREKFGIDICGKRHDLGPDAPDPQAGSIKPGTTEMADVIPWSRIESSGKLWNRLDYVATCAEYNVKPIDDESKTVQCLGCGITNPSLEDRMLKKPGIDGCGGCQHKQAHG